MDTPAFQQLTGLLTVVKAGLRADSYLTGSGDGQLGYTADQVCKGIYPHKMFSTEQDGIAPHVTLGKVNLPALAIYVDEAEFSTDVYGSDGLMCSLGIQYLWESRAKDVDSQAFSAHFAMVIWWKIIEIVKANMRATAGSLRSTYHIDALGLEGMRLLPPFDQAVRALEAQGSMDFKRPPWDTGADSSQVVDLASIYSDHNETSDVGASPLTQSIYEP